ncbi:MAG TPA: DUF29 domain-containing protein [Phenylobacterium sp.]|jgi:hypothetical protein|uniref:DUF29 domain-containing protein n=1 Tax=Phenylobacterium sp. TaxID=1871053 RepID=UPI002D3D1345|nr:DUF29 domain-containing protein [Phenylobacterium sp.]HZZ68796.1 DUF29 domain-containing protein [Phenylobacterium sp.]
MTKLYDRDFFGWTQDQADALRRRSVNELDWENLLEEVEGIGKQARGELRSHLIVLLAHLLKWRLQPERRSRSWMFTILEQRREAERMVDENPSLKPELPEILADAYKTARLRAAREPRLTIKRFPAENPFTWEMAMTEAVGEPD